MHLDDTYVKLATALLQFGAAYLALRQLRVSKKTPSVEVFPLGKFPKKNGSILLCVPHMIWQPFFKNSGHTSFLF